MNKKTETMKRYDTYKDSGVQWVGEIPGHWKTQKIKYTFEERSEKNHPNEPILCATQSQGVIPQSMYDNRVVVVNKGFENLKLVKVGDFVISLRSFQGGIEYAYYQGIISAAYTILHPNESIAPGYARLLMKSHHFIQLLKTCVTGIREGQNINYDLLKNKFIPIPPLAEQEAIVAFLDEKTGEIDGLVSQVEHEIELLKEYKQAEIARVVTKGLNPDAPMRPSGISWIGDIPAHWEVRKLFQVVTSYYESNKGLKNTNLLSLSYGSIIQKDINKTDGLLPASFETYQIIKPNIIVLRLTDLQNDHKSLRVGISKYEGIITSAYEALKVREPNDADYIYYQLHVNDIHKVFYGMGGGLRQNLNYDGMRYMLIVAPPVSEQKEIVEYINYKTTEIDRLVVELTNQVEYLKEYKQRLIADVVTGKINVQTN